MNVNDVAHLARLTPRFVQYECKSGRLKATLVSKRAGYRIDKADYVTWLAEMHTWRRRWNKGKRK